MRITIATLTIATLTSIVAVGAQAAPTQLNVRIEGKSETLFEGPIWTEGRYVRAASDTKERECDGINSLDPQNVAPRPTPTVASADAMSLIGESFDGRWYPGYNDYFITRWGADSEEEGMSWGMLVNNVFSDVGGCQYQLRAGDEVLWAYNAFDHQPLLALYPVGDTSGARPLTATAELNKPFEVEVVDYGNDAEGAPPTHPERTGSAPYEGAEVSPVQTNAKGFEKVQTGSPATVTTNAQGKATLELTEPGWHRIKATALGTGAREKVIRSNRLDVCVPAQGTSGCGFPPVEDQVRTPPPTGEGAKREEEVTPAPEGKPESAGQPPSAPNNARNRKRLDSTVRYLQDVQNMDGGFGGERGRASDPDFGAWVALALAAAGINPKDQAQPGGVDAYTYLAKHAGELTFTTDFERVLLVVDASESTPHDFGKVDLVRQILGRRISDGSFAHEDGAKTAGMNDTVFAILSLSAVGEPIAREAVQRAAQWLEGEQSSDGSWPGICPKTSVTTCADNGPERGEVDMTAAVIEALSAAGRHDTVAQKRAFEYLHLAQDSNGGFPEYPGESEPNVASTAWVVQAIWSAGQNPETWEKGAGAEPLSYMESMQHEDGSIQWKASSDANPVWMTAYVAPAFAGQWLPLAGVPPAVQTPPTPSSGASAIPPSPGTAEPGQGGESSQSGSGVIAGGGGNGAALFSRPKPQSKGKTPGGVRLLGSRHQESATKRRHEKITKHGREPGSASTRTGSGGSAGGRALSTTGNDTEQAGGQKVKGVLIGRPDSIGGQHGTEPGAPGFHSAGAGGNQTPWLAIGIGAAIALLVLAGSLLERRRPRVIL